MIVASVFQKAVFVSGGEIAWMFLPTESVFAKCLAFGFVHRPGPWSPLTHTTSTY
jgi:hypothetical protein